MQQTLVSELPILLPVNDISLRLQWIFPLPICSVQDYQIPAYPCAKVADAPRYYELVRPACGVFKF